MQVTTLRTEDGRVVCARCALATTFWTRFRGLMGRASLAQDEGMLFRPGGSIHMFFMRFPIDAVFCDGELRVLKVARGLRPWRVAGARGAKVTIELAAGAAAGLREGERLALGD
ncbi:MAG TPA: DUF192 domain-containing protein [Gaiellaceae bacterium]|nr:DUF192 domain-containing protein [Gaiellaceae bacterium]